MADFQPKQRLLDFQEIEDSDTDENLASIVYTILCELDIGAKLLSITGDNASNNLAMTEILYDMLKADYDMKIFSQGNTQSVMRYHEELSFVHCLAHILNLIVKKFLAILKTNDITADYEIVADLKNNLLIIQSQSAFSHIQILVLYISATSEQKKK